MTSSNTAPVTDAAEFAAAALTNALGSLMDELLNSAEARDVAAKMGVSLSRISQLKSSDGNVRVSTLAKIANACGYALSVTATPLAGEGRSITVPRVGRPRRKSGVRQPALKVVEAKDVYSHGAKPSWFVA